MQMPQAIDSVFDAVNSLYLFVWTFLMCDKETIKVIHSIILQFKVDWDGGKELKDVC